MYQEIFGIIDSYSVMMVLALVAAFVLLYLFLRFKKTSKAELVDIVICGSFAIASGYFASLKLYTLFKTFLCWTCAMTLWSLSGVVGYLAVYALFIPNTLKGDIGKVLVIAPACITIAHAIGRIGCFLEGCCHGIETTEWYGMYFPSDGKTYIPTQLYEAIFLFALTAVLVVLAYKKSYRYNFVIYVLAYGAFRFLIEFIRGDERGGFIGIFSPSQIWSIVLIALAVPLYFVLKKFTSKGQENGKA